MPHTAKQPLHARFVNKTCLVALLGALCTVTGSATADVIYDANAAFVANELNSATELSSTFGPFSVGHADEASPGSFTAFTAAQHTNIFTPSGANPNIQGFFVDNNVDVPGVLVNVSATGQSPCCGISPLDPNQIFMHPSGIGTDGFGAPIHDAIVRFTAVFASLYIIGGDWESLHSGTTNNIVRHNGTDIFSSTDANSVFNLSVNLLAGDAIDFVVNDFNGIGGDSTGLRANLRAVPAPPTTALLALGLLGAAFSRRRRTH
jgi:hypothetical protein